MKYLKQVIKFIIYINKNGKSGKSQTPVLMTTPSILSEEPRGSYQRGGTFQPNYIIKNRVKQ